MFPWQCRDLSRYDAFHIIALPQKSLHSYLLHFPNAIHARLVLADRAEFGRDRMKRRTKVNVGILQWFIFAVGPNMERHLQDQDHRQEPAEAHDSQQEQANRVYLAEAHSNRNGFWVPQIFAGLFGTILNRQRFLHFFWNLEAYPSALDGIRPHQVHLRFSSFGIIYRDHVPLNLAFGHWQAYDLTSLLVHVNPVHFHLRMVACSCNTLVGKSVSDNWLGPWCRSRLHGEQDFTSRRFSAVKFTLRWKLEREFTFETPRY